MKEVRFHVPRIPSGMFGNLIGLAGLVAVAACVGGFLSALNVPGAWWITGVLSGAILFGLASVAASNAQAEAAPSEAWAKEPTRNLRQVKPSASKPA